MPLPQRSKISAFNCNSFQPYQFLATFVRRHNPILCSCAFPSYPKDRCLAFSPGSFLHDADHFLVLAPRIECFLADRRDFSLVSNKFAEVIWLCSETSRISMNSIEAKKLTITVELINVSSSSEQKLENAKPHKRHVRGRSIF